MAAGRGEMRVYDAAGSLLAGVGDPVLAPRKFT